MEKTLKEAEKPAQSIGSRARLMIVGVFFPGFLLLCEFAYAYSLQRYSGAEIIAYLVEKTKEVNSIIMTFLAVSFVLAISCAAGYLARDVTFAISNFWLARGWPPARELTRVIEQIRFVYGGHRVDNVIKLYDVFKLI